MARKVVVTVLVIVACVLIFYWYTNRVESRNSDGSVYSTDAHPSTDAHSSSDDRTSVGPTPSRSDAPGTVNTTPVVSTTQAQNLPSYPAPVHNDPSTVPVTDTVAPNAPNGLAFGGTGKFQWYRQGNLTWRVDTANGISCIAFATMEEWRKPIVYTHGCGTADTQLH